MPNTSWTETEIYKVLSSRGGAGAAEIRNLLERPTVMTTIDQILRLSGTTPRDFTLHDSAHSFRVAERMWKLIPEGTRGILSGYELGLLLLSAYLHDIGMSPEFDKVQRHHQFLTGENDAALDSREIAEFQKWIDNDGRTTNLDISKQKKVSDPELINYILSYYIRHKHNDWSGEWIEKYLKGEILINYTDWVSDLVLICKSHHYGLDHLKQEEFDPRFVIGGEVVHLRYLAMCLRIADVTENDPERTPAVILAQRQISKGSQTYWIKDHDFQLRQDDKDGTFSIYSRPKRAYIHKAVEETANQIEEELKLCEQLIRIRPLDHSNMMEIKGYAWVLKPFLKRDIQPYPNTYEYIQGAFRPNTAKILELLGGSELYGDPIFAFRELLQNAFDAVKEEIAYQIINKDWDVKEHLRRLQEQATIEVSLEKQPDGIWLICRDPGVGMTRGIIEKFFCGMAPHSVMR